MITQAFLYESSLQYRIKALENELEAFKTGKKYLKMKEAHRKETDALRREIERLKKELALAHKETIHVREKWFATCDDIIAEEDANLRKAQDQILKLKQRCFDADMKRHEEKAALADAYEKKLEEKDKTIKELENRLAHAEALLARDGTNTGIPTAQTPIGKKKVIPNSRRSTGRTNSICRSLRMKIRSTRPSCMKSILPKRNALSADQILSFIREGRR